MSEPTSLPAASLPCSLREALQEFAAWCRREPLNAALLAAVIAVVLYFFGFYSVFMNGRESTAVWASRSWNSENDLEHGWLIFPAAIFIIWFHRAQFRDAPKSPSASGMLFIAGAIVLFVLAVRSLQPRVALLAFPVLCYGITRFLWGRETARLVIFPCAFLLFTIPVGFLVSRTVGLQTLAAGFASKLSSLIGIGVVSDGATLRALDGSFQYEVAGGCSGIRSLTAMTMLAALYVHFTQREWWKKCLIFAGSLVFALIGNLVRIFTVVLFARFINADLAGGLYHDYSGFIFFPIAVGAMVGFSNLLNRDWSKVREILMARDRAAVPEATTPTDPTRKEPSSISYDY